MPDTDHETPEPTEAAIDHGETDTTDATTDDDTTEATDTERSAGGDLGERGKKAIEAEREARKAIERKYREAQAQLKEYEDRNKSELQKLVERAEAAELAKAEAERATAEAELSALRSRVAADRGVPIKVLNGTTEEELHAAADEVLAWAQRNNGVVKRNPGSPGKSGASGSENTNPDPKAFAAQALQRLYRSG